MPMERLAILILFVFVFNVSPANSIDDIVKKHTDSLKSHGIEKVFVHQYSLFNGRYSIPYDNDELRCDDIPTVVHLFWFEGGQWNCLRLDKCGLFEIVKLRKTDFDKLTVDKQIQFKKESAHFTEYKLTRLFNDSIDTVSISGSQLNSEKSEAIKTFKRINKVIKRLEKNHRFKRVQL